MEDKNREKGKTSLGTIEKIEQRMMSQTHQVIQNIMGYLFNHLIG